MILRESPTEYVINLKNSTHSDMTQLEIVSMLEEFYGYKYHTNPASWHMGDYPYAFLSESMRGYKIVGAMNQELRRDYLRYVVPFEDVIDTLKDRAGIREKENKQLKAFTFHDELQGII